ncbi:hypothetical protein Misp01_01520 [Microtetraspora sp. NBRC 13810]|uniref:serine/threonine protein kinase n=1 Tax=Microtetraspora sp. NBRC 13810 TaxID=3030990 RepID=UPI0024A2530B|nr:serine/threonine-protein kinase [Microtetraspora sp. NBRC 13810]GLW05022.1 hypothetical protein Misp01_01520 [Microtetraspora sp. NBRC 13810]
MHPLRRSDPRRIADYELLGLLGDGDRGTTYLGRAPGDRRDLVIRLFPEDPGPHPALLERLHAARRVSSSYVARVLAAGTHGGRPYMVREYVEGRSLAEIVAADGPLTGDALERVAVGVLTALTAVHLAGLAHRALSPGNVILGADGPRVTDVGVAEAADEVGYRSPEQLGGQPHGPGGDVFGWAAVVVHAGTGAAPFGHRPEAVLNGRPDAGALEQPLRRVVVSALEKAADRRPSASAALLRLLGDRTADTLVAGAPKPARAGRKAHSGESHRMPPIEGTPLPPDGPTMPLPQGAQPWDPPGVPTPPRTPPPGPPPYGGPETGGPPAQAQHGQQGQGEPGPAGQEGWAPPPAPMSQEHREQAGRKPPLTIQGRTQDDSPRKPFPIGLVAAVGAVVLLSGVGLWGAGQYASGPVSLEPAAAGAGATPRGHAAGGAGAGGTALGPADPLASAKPSVTVPWEGSTPEGIAPEALDLPTEWPSETPAAPEFTMIAPPTATATVAPPTVAPPTVTASAAAPPTTPPTTPQPTAQPTRTVTVTPTPSPAQTQTQQATPTQQATQPQPAPQPSPPAQTTAPDPEPQETADPPTQEPEKPAPPRSNPYTATQVCGPGFYVQRSGAFTGGTTYQLYNGSTGENCVVTIKTADVGRATQVSATLEVQGGGSQTDSDAYEYYAGPVILPAKGKCVRFSGGVGRESTEAGWANCG